MFVVPRPRMLVERVQFALWEQSAVGRRMIAEAELEQLSGSGHPGMQASTDILITTINRPHCLHPVHRCGLLLQMLHTAWSVCLSVRVLGKQMSCAKMVEPFKMPFAVICCTDAVPSMPWGHACRTAGLERLRFIPKTTNRYFSLWPHWRSTNLPFFLRTCSRPKNCQISLTSVYSFRPYWNFMRYINLLTYLKRL